MGFLALIVDVIFELLLPFVTLSLPVVVVDWEGPAVQGLELVFAVVGFAEAVVRGGKDDSIDFLVFELRQGLVDDGVQIVVYFPVAAGEEGGSG